MHRPRSLAAAASVVVAWLAAASASSATPCAPPLRPRLAEILYDAAGDDSGREFVEFFNPHGLALSLAGARLEVGDGSGPGRWTTRWTGSAADTVAAGGRFVVGGAFVDASPKALAALDLQNGPDAVRVVWPDGASELVGYGALEFPEYYCGSPAPDAASGQSLARLPDGADTGDNGSDFRPAPPSPGHPNQRRRDAALIAGASKANPEQPVPGAPFQAVALVENRGLETLAAGEVTWAARAAGEAAPLAIGSLAVSLAPAETAAVVVDLPGLVAGKHRLALALALPGDEGPDNDADSLWVRVGQGPLQITEIQFHPAASEGEWVEVVNAGSAPLDLASFVLSDRRGTPRPIVGAGVLAPESLAVLAQDPPALLARFPLLDTLRVLRVSGWPSLNNSDDAGGVADVVSVVELDGTPSDRVAYSAAGVPAGAPLERSSGGSWGPASLVGGTPLGPPAPVAAIAGGFAVEPRRVALGASARVRWELPWPRARVALELYDLAGRPRGQVLAEIAAAGRGELLWVPRDLAAGLYVMVLRARAEGSDGSLAVARALRLEAP